MMRCEVMRGYKMKSYHFSGILYSERFFFFFGATSLPYSCGRERQFEQSKVGEKTFEK